MMRLSAILMALAAAFPVSAARIVPAGDVMVYVAPAAGCANAYWTPGIPVTACGSDTTGDGTREHPFATMQKAHDTLAAGYDFQFQFRATIQLAVGNAGTQIYHPPGLLISGRLIGQGGTVAPLNFGTQSMKIGKYLPYTLRGDPANVTGAFIYAMNATPPLPCVSLSDGAGLRIEGVTCGAVGYDADCMDVFNHSYLDLSNVWFGHCGYPHFFLGVGVAWSSVLMLSGPVTLTGQMASFVQIAGGSTMMGNADSGSPSIPVNIIGNPAVSAGLFTIDQSTVFASQMAFTGTINGPKALILRNGVLFTNTGNGGPKSCFTNPGTANYIPGTWDAASMVQDNSVCR